MNKKLLRKLAKIIIVASCFTAAIIVCPIISIILLIWFLLGLIDVLRNRPIDGLLLKRYFLGNGLLTFILSPLNLLCDLICYRNHKVYNLDDYPEAWKEEITKVIQIFDENKTKIIADLDSRMADKKRGMVFYKWYNQNYNMSILEFNQHFRYIKTIGVSVFSPKQSTSWHFGPLRLSLRILYNLLPVDSKEAYIKTMGKTYYWKDSPFFSFDDTLFHRSVNDTKHLRYCAFIDIIRPSPVPSIINILAISLGFIIQKIRGVFYKHWDLLS